MPLLDEVSEHARIIGAVNTIVPQQEGSAVRLIGDNTDWLGLLELIEQNLSSDNERTDASTSLVLGAGGTCRAAVYALHKAGFKTIYLFNRTRPNADKIVASFPVEYNIVPLTSLDAFPGEAPLAVISTIPAQGTATQYERGGRRRCTGLDPCSRRRRRLDRRRLQAQGHSPHRPRSAYRRMDRGSWYPDAA
jgi:pentafunctional AROM polypeptide